MFDQIDSDIAKAAIPVPSPWNHQVYGVTEAWNALRHQSTVCLNAPTGCHEKGHPILMRSGVIKNVEDVRVGDELVGPDGNPRVVLRLCRGVGEMFKITPCRGKPFVVNEDHILCLKETNQGKKHGKPGRIVNISVKDYLGKTKNWKHLRKLWYSPAEFSPSKLDRPIDPYVLGITLGDGNVANAISIHKPDEEVLSAFEKEVLSSGSKAKRVLRPGVCPYVLVGSRGKGDSPFRDKLKSIGVWGTKSDTKFIPQQYISAPSDVRVGVLAGLLDTDGHLSGGCYDYVTKSSRLAEGAALIARSLGFRVCHTLQYKSCQTGAGGYYHRLSIAGDCSAIPCRVERKRASKRLQKKNVLYTGFSIEPVGVGEFFGFEISGDHLYLDGYCMVHHNSGKSVMMSGLINLATDMGLRVVLYTNRRMLTRQTCANLDKHGISYGVRAAALRDKYAPNYPVQISSIATEVQRVYHQKIWELHKADLVIVDEAHLYNGRSCIEIFQSHLSQDAKIVGVTATPVGISHVYKKLVVAGKNSDMRACGAHVPVVVYPVREMDVGRINRQKTGEFLLGDIRKEVWSQAIVGYVYEDWKKFNPDARQALGFAPGVEESIYLAQQFKKNGVRVAHIDAKNIWIDGERLQDDDEGTARQHVIDEWTAGGIKVLWNRFVMREAIDVPSLYHMILATPIGSLKSYVQIVGRVQRRSDATPDKVIITDHGGNYWRHGSPNQDHDWESMFSMSETEIAEAREAKAKESKELEPIICPECGAARVSGARCPQCGFVGASNTRIVIQQNGRLVEVNEPIFKESKPKKLKTLDQSRWDQVYWRARHSGRTFKQAMAIYKKEFGEWPSKSLYNQPVSDLDWERKVSAVRMRDLRREDTN